MKLRTVALVIASVVLPGQAFAFPWSTDMMNQPSIKPQEGPPAPFPKRSVPAMGIPTKVDNRDEAKDLKNPFAATDEKSLKKGRTLFRIICSACHGLSGKADSPVSEKIGAIDLTSEYVQQQLTEGWVWGTVSFGSAIMPAYGVPRREGGGSNDLNPEERWHVVNYVKHGLVKEGQATAQAAPAPAK